MKSIILASSSPNRKALLARLGLSFTAISPDIDESPLPGESPEDLSLRLSREKAQKIALSHPQTLVIGSDQVCAVGNHLINKPETLENALAQWELLSGQTAIFYTGICLVEGETVTTVMVPTEVKFKALPLSAFEAYLKKDQSLDCCAGFKIESLGIVLTEWVKSEDPTALIGLPLIQTAELLEERGVNLFA